jgi:CheY-like chemotaxis protein
MSKTIMIVDDEADIRFIIRSILEKEGYTIIEAKNGKECIEKISEKIDLVLMDIIMPVMDGWDTITKIKNNIKYSSIPFSFLTALPISPKEIKEKPLHLLDNYIMKPFQKNQLIKIVKEIIDTRTKLDRNTRQLAQIAGNSVAQEYKKLTNEINRYNRLANSLLEYAQGAGALTPSVNEAIKSYEKKIQMYKKKVEKLAGSTTR